MKSDLANEIFEQYNPEDYIQSTKLPQDRGEILKLWHTNHKKEIFFLVEYLPEYAVALSSNGHGEDTLYGIKGISDSVANTLRRILPAPIETVLLPFKGKIIYDGFLKSLQIGFGEGAQASIREMYDRVKGQGVITSLD